MKHLKYGLTVIALLSSLTLAEAAQAQEDGSSSALPPQLVVPDPTFNQASGSVFTPGYGLSQGQWLRSTLPTTGLSLGLGLAGVGVPYVGNVGVPYVGGLGVPYVGSLGLPSLPYTSFGHLSSFSPLGAYTGFGHTGHSFGLGSMGWGYGGYSPYQYSRYWGGNYGLHGGGIPSSGKLSSVQVIQTAPSKASGNYYNAATTDPTASGNYYAGSGNHSYFGNSSVYNSGPYSTRRSLNNSSESNWGASGNPFPKDLNSTPWSSK